MSTLPVGRTEANILALRTATGFNPSPANENSTGQAEPTDSGLAGTIGSLLTADAGIGRTVRAGQTVQLDGSASRFATSFAWTLYSKPAGSAAALTTPTANTAGMTADVKGTYRIQLKTSRAPANAYDVIDIIAI